jgi:type I restriction enzyme, S subunit
MKLETFFEKFEQFAEAPNAVAKMRELILQLAVQGKLVEQNSNEAHAEESLRQVTRTVRLIAVNDEAKVPTGWVSIPLGCAIGSNTGGGTPSKQNPSYWNGSIPWASVKDIQTDKYLTTTIDTITEEGLKNSSSNFIPPNCLLVVTRMGLGKLAINKIPVAINQDLRAIEPNEALALDFAYLLFKALKLVGKGVTVKGVTIEELHSTPIALPPIAEQKRIVAKVDELMALCDRLETQQQELDIRHAALARAALARFADAPTPDNLDFLFHNSYTITPADLRKTILTLAVQGKLVPQDPNDEPAEKLLALIAKRLTKSQTSRSRGDTCSEPETACPFELPPGWAWSRFPNLGEFGRGKSKHRPRNDPSLFLGGKYRLVQTGDVARANGTIQTHTSLYNDVGLAQSKMWPTGTLCITIAANIADSGILGFDACFPDSVVGFIPAEPIPSVRYFEYFMRTAKEHLETFAPSTAQKNINLGILEQVLIPIPPAVEQRRIVAKVDQLMALVDQLETQLATSRAAAINLMEAVVAELTAQE